MGSVVDVGSAISSKEITSEETLMKKKPTVVFVLGKYINILCIYLCIFFHFWIKIAIFYLDEAGGPGGGKSTQWTKIAKEIGYAHLSSGGLLRKASKLDPENGPMIESMLKEGQSVSPEYTMEIIKKAMKESNNDKFLLDGFPRDEDIRAAFESALSIEPELLLFFDCSEEERERRILSRKQERVDDNEESVRKRFIYFEEHTLPVVEYYKSRGKVKKIDAGKSMEEVFIIVKSYLTSSNIHSEAEAEAGDIMEVESKSSVLSVAEDDLLAVEAEEKTVAEVGVPETEVEEFSKDIMRMKL